MLIDFTSINENIKIKSNVVQLYIKREDQIHPYISGNKYRKLKYNIIEAKQTGCDTLLTFGGAFSNHIASVAAAGNLFGLKTIAVIRGEELESKIHQNPTLHFCKSQGMNFNFVSRELYRNKNDIEYLKQLKAIYGNVYIIPEGGTNFLGVKGCEEILNNNDIDFDYICCPVGTGGTISGIIQSSYSHQFILGFSSLKGNFLTKDIRKFVQKKNWAITSEYHFGGYARVKEPLIQFINAFKREQNILLDPIYTGKMMYGIFDLIEKGYFKTNSKILAIHTGGLQSIEGMNNILRRKNTPIIEIP